MMVTTEEWHADIEVTDEIVQSCLQEQFPTLAPIKEIKHIDAGWDNKVFLVNKKIIFRFPRRKVAIQYMEHENKVLSKLSTLLKSDIEIPTPKYIGHPTPYYPYPFQGYEIIKGISAYQAQITSQDREASLPRLASFLKQLHSIDEAQAMDIGATPSVWDRTIAEKAVDALTQRVTKLISRKLCDINETCFQAEMRTAQKLILPNEKCLVHGDLDSRHLIFNRNKLVGIIDWGDLGINNRAMDLDIIWSFYPSSCHKQFFEFYGPVDTNTWQYARFLGLYCAFTHLLYGKDIGDTLLVNESVNAIKRINASLMH